MTTTQLFRLAAAAAIAGGLLRIFAAFPLISDPITLEWLYTGIDVLLLFGLIGIYLDRSERLGFLGLASFGVGVVAMTPMPQYYGFMGAGILFGAGFAWAGAALWQRRA